MLGYYRLALAVGVAIAHLALLSAGTVRSLVAAFFVVSGFLMALTLTRNYPARAAGLPSPRAFYWNRFLRIYPLHVCLSLAVLAGAAAGLLRIPGGLPSAPAFLASLTLFHDHSDLLIAPAWSLFYEVLFYACAPFLVLRGGRVALGAAALCLAALAWQGELRAAVQPFMRYGAIFDLSVALPAAGLLFLLGVGLFMVKDRLALRLAAGEAIQRGALVAIGVLGVAACAGVQGPAVMTLDARHGQAIHLAVLALTMIFLLAWDERRESPGSTRAGDYCFPVYMLHWPALIYVPGGYQLGAGLALTFAAAWAWLALERRTFARLRRRPAPGAPREARIPAAEPAPVAAP